MTTQVAYGILLTLVGVERLFELWLARRNGKRARARGAQEHGASHYPLMVALHSGFLAACALEVFGLARPVSPAVFAVGTLVVVAAQVLRYVAIATLGDRWNVRVLVEPGRPPVQRGIYRLVRHPNYIAVVVEIAALPLTHGAWITALVFSVLNLLLLRVRIRVEERALASAAATAEFSGGL